MSQGLRTLAETSALIAAGRPLLIAGDEAILRALPPGSWIGGTAAYFITEDGGVCVRDRLFVTELPGNASDATPVLCDAAALARIYQDGPANGVSFVILPGGSEIHEAFALEGPSYAGFGTHPVVGWIAGVHLEELGHTRPKVFVGSTVEAHGDRAAVLHVKLPASVSVDLDILNLFEQGEGDAIRFLEGGFTVRDAVIDGEVRNLAGYYRERAVDTTLPLVADYGGAAINVSIQSVDFERGEVKLYAPVLPGMTYKHARPVADYVTEFERRLPKSVTRDLLFSCNCILNYVNAKLEGRRVGGVTGPATFGEVAYQLLNQTMVHVSLVAAPAD